MDAPARTAPHAGPPRLLLDVDGVLNAFPRWGSRGDFIRHDIDGYPIHFHPELPDMVAELQQHFDIAWFTLWNRKAAPLIGPHVGLEDVPYLETSWERGIEILVAEGWSDVELQNLMFAKTPLLPRLLDRGQRWVWIDDAHSRLDQNYLESRGFAPADFRLIRTHEREGLTWDEVGLAVDIARAWALGGDAGAGAAAPAPTERSEPVRPGSVAGRTDAVQ